MYAYMRISLHTILDRAKDCVYTTNGQKWSEPREKEELKKKLS